MRQAFLTGQDIHRSTAAKIYNLPPEMITPALRSSAKAVNFGIVYGIGAFSLSRDINVSVKEADQFIKNYLATFPGVKNLYGRNHRPRHREGLCDHPVRPPPGSARAGQQKPQPAGAGRADGHEHSHSGHRGGCDQAGHGEGMAAAAHRGPGRKADSAGARRTDRGGPGAEAETVARILKEEMEGAVSYSVPLTADVGQGKTWLKSH